MWEQEDRYRARKRLIWGFFLVALGSAFLLDRMGIVDLPSIGRMWPLVFAVIATGRFVEGQYGHGVFMLLLGVWFFLCEFGWYGFNYGNSWPLILIAVGAGTVVRALGGDRGRRAREGGGSC